MTDPRGYGENPGGYYQYSSGYPYGYPPQRGTNSLAIASLVCAFVFAPLGIIFGHMSLSQIRKTGEEGRGLAIAGLVIGYLAVVATVVVVLVSVAMLVVVARELETIDDNMLADYDPTTVPSAELPLPPFKPSQTLGSNCQYPATTEPASKPVRPPQVGKTPTTPETIPASIVTDRGDIGLLLDNQKAPCTVKNFTSLAEQGFYADTRCHRLTVGAELRVLQCGDPSGTGTGGPGYRFPNEYPTNQYRLTDPTIKTPVTYPRGTLAMANAGIGTNGSQFFLVYDDSALPPEFTVFGTINPKGLAALDRIAAGGVKDGAEDGQPATEVTIESVRVG